MRFWRIILPLLLFVSFFLISCSSEKQTLVGSMDSYEVVVDASINNLDWINDYEANSNFHMPESVLKDIHRSPSDYAVYRISLLIKNVSDHPVYAVQTELSQKYRNLWLDTTSLCQCQPLDIEQNETYESCVLVIIHTKDMTKDEIGDLITGMKMNLTYSNHSFEEENLGFILSFIRGNASAEYTK